MGIANLAAVDQRLRRRESRAEPGRGPQRLRTRHPRSKQLRLNVMHRPQTRQRLTRLMSLHHDTPAVGQPNP